jgi:AAA domain
VTEQVDPVLELFSSPRKSLRDRLVSGEAIFDVPPPHPLVGDLLQSDSLAIVSGAPGSMKTFLELDVLLSVASARPWQGRPVVDGPVLYIVAEDAPGVSKRARAWQSRHGSLGNIHWLLQRVPLLENDAMSELCEIVGEIAPAAIGMDTLARCMTGADESSSRDMGLAVDALDRLRGVIGSCVLVVHHDGKDPSRGMRGSSALLAAADTAIQCKRTRDGMTATIVKQKNAADGQCLHFTLEPEGDSAVLVETSAPSANGDGFRPTVLMERGSRYLESNANASLRSIRTGVGGKVDYIDLAIQRLIDEGFVETSTGPRGATWHRSLAPFREAE